MSPWTRKLEEVQSQAGTTYSSTTSLAWEMKSQVMVVHSQCVCKKKVRGGQERWHLVKACWPGFDP